MCRKARLGKLEGIAPTQDFKSTFIEMTCSGDVL
jgi:hypothetical protein